MSSFLHLFALDEFLRSPGFGTVQIFKKCGGLDFFFFFFLSLSGISNLICIDTNKKSNQRQLNENQRERKRETMGGG